MEREELPKWLRENSSGIYRPAAEAADYIELLEAECDAYHSTLKQLLKRNILPEDESQNIRALLQC